MTNPDIRWRQRFEHFKAALTALEEGVQLSRQRALSRLEQQGLIQAFEFTHELAWNTLKDFLEERGVTNLYGSKDTTRQAFKAGLIEDGESWMKMIESRNLTTHTYNQSLADEISRKIIGHYFQVITQLQQRLAAESLQNE
jgi:nucleotidyltransferase substrate binding protein (TIGR01987 family)